MTQGHAQTRAEIIADLRAILDKHLREWRTPWPGADFGKTLIGNSLLGALKAHGCDPGQELRDAVTADRV